MGHNLTASTQQDYQEMICSSCFKNDRKANIYLKIKWWWGGQFALLDIPIFRLWVTNISQWLIILTIIRWKKEETLQSNKKALTSANVLSRWILSISPKYRPYSIKGPLRGFERSSRDKRWPWAWQFFKKHFFSSRWFQINIFSRSSLKLAHSTVQPLTRWHTQYTR